jgi:hypothetical protein
MGDRGAPHPYARLDERRQLGEIGTDDGAVKLWAAPTQTDGRCVWLEFHGEERAVMPCLPKGYERQTALSTNLHDFGGTSVLFGECGYPAVEIERPDGSLRRIDCRDGVLFAKLDRADLDATLRAVDADGKPLAGSEVSLLKLRS